MTSGDFQPFSQVPPPTEFEGLPDKPSSWPTVVGVVGIILASIGLLFGCCGFFSVPLQRWGLEMQKQSGQSTEAAEVQLQVAEQFQIPTMVMVGLGLLASAWLLVASIALVRRRPTARKHFIGYGFASLVLMAINLVFQILMMQAGVEALTQAGHGDHVGELYLGLAIGGCIGLVFGLAWPVFLLIWFSRAKIKNEIATWR